MAKILLVDDDLTVRRVVSYMLRQAQHEVELAVDGQDAWAKLAAKPVDLVVLDVAMPVLDGIELLKLIRNDPEYEHLPVVMLTASKEERDRVEALEAGADAFLSKVVKSDALLATIQKLLGQ